MMNLLSIFLVISALGILTSCDQRNEDIEWVESNVLCVHWTEHDKRTFVTKAISFTVKSQNADVFSGKSFYLITDSRIENIDNLKLDHFNKIVQEGDFFYAGLYVRSDQLYEYFPEGKSFYNDDCYSVELGNIAGTGKIVMIDNLDTVVIKKSPNFSFTIGLL